MISPIVFLAAGSALAAQQQPSATQPFYMQKASSSMVSYAAKYRATGVPEDQASSAAAEVVSSLLAPSQATNLVRSAVSYYAVNGPEITGSKAAELVSKASSYYNDMNTKPAYTDFAKLVKEKKPMFDVARGYDETQQRLMKVSGDHSAKAGKLATHFVTNYRKLKADPEGSQAIANGKQLAKNIAADFDIKPNAVKQKMLDTKAKFVNLILDNLN